MSTKLYVPYAVAYLTNACNLNCDYCFAKELPPKSMSPETGRRVMDWLFQGAKDGPEDPLILAFFGGEPLLRFDLLKDMVLYGKRLSDTYGKEIVYSVTTNGTLITDELLDLCEENKIAVLFSCDGDRDTNDRHRRFKNGASINDILYKNAQRVLERFPGSAVRMSVERETVPYVAKNVKFLADLGFRFISACPVLESITDHETWEEFDRQYRAATEFAVDKILGGDFVHLHFLDNGVDHIEFEREIDVACGAGKTFMGIDVDGDLYPCHRFVAYSGKDNKAFRLGNVFSGINPAKTLPFRRYDRNSILGCYTRCEDCRVRDFCAGGCIALNHEVNANFLAPVIDQQKLMNIWYQICLDTIEAFKRLDKYDLLLENIKEKPTSFLPILD